MNVLKPGLQATIKTLLSKGVSQREIVNWGLTKPVHRFYIGKSAAGVDTCPKSLTTHLNFPTVFGAAAAARSCQRLKRRQVKPRSQKPMSFLKEAPEVESAGNIESQHHPPPEKLDAATSLLYPDIFRLETVSIPGSFSKRPAAAAFSASYMPGQSIPPSRRFAKGSPLNRSRFRGESRLIKLSSAIFTLTRLLLNRFMRLQKG